MSSRLLPLLLGAIFLALAPPVRPAAAADPGDVTRVTSQLVCPCNPNLTVAACQESIQCSLAEKMEKLADELLTEGKSRNEVLDYFVEVYGDAILTAPRTQGIGLSAWAMPFVALALGIAIVSWFFFRSSRRRKAAEETQSTAPPDLEKYRRQVERDLET